MAQVVLDSDGLPTLSFPTADPCTAAAAASAAAAEVKTGTTIVACCYSDGVVLGADTRTSAGSYVVNRAARKITKLADRICVCRSGSAADTQTLAQIVRLHLELYTQQLPPQFNREAQVRVAAHLLQRLAYEYKDMLTAGLIVGGWDSQRGPQVYSVPLGGCCVPVPYTAGGSGSMFITAYLDEHYRPDMTKEETVNLVKRAVSHAIHRDGSSGGMIRLVTISKDEMEEMCVEGNRLPGDWGGDAHAAAAAAEAAAIVGACKEPATKKRRGCSSSDEG
ncbi:proteasome component PRE3 precursor, putative [Eimeria necatrix]|uniref:proteasome endopeptidase complex n=1 Tax=Eimeria necatrix TaxID=51315 RepID=U6MX42_9EIME|nr:proteasome component PRE3 precursor, putative [Eimeria necatrix]CDJ67044.1 proteasome component PRE3 precursor, putative [Eimeria necatrix]